MFGCGNVHVYRFILKKQDWSLFNLPRLFKLKTKVVLQTPSMSLIVQQLVQISPPLAVGDFNYKFKYNRNNNRVA